MRQMAGWEDRLTGESLETAAKEFFTELDAEEAEEVTASSEDGGGEANEEETTDEPSVENEETDSPEGNEEGVDEDSSSRSDSAPSDFLDFGDKGKFTRQEVENLIAFQQFVRNNPVVADGIAKLVSGAEPDAPIANPTAPKIDSVPEGLDLDDPAIKALWEEHLAVRSRLDQLVPQIETATRQINLQQAEQAQTFLVRAKDSFQKEFDLTAEDMAKVTDTAARMNVLPALMNPIDPVTGLPRTVDPLQALDTSFRTAYSLMPEFESRRLAKVQAAEQASKNKKKKLSSLAGSSGSVPKSTMQREPKTASDRRTAMIAEVANAMFGTTTGEQ